MKRVVALSIAVMYASMATAFAQEPVSRKITAPASVTFAPPAPAPVVSLVPALRQQTVKLTAMAVPAPARVTLTPRMNLSTAAAAGANASSSKSFWKTPWPYVIAGAAVGVAVVVAKKGYKSNVAGCSDPSCSIY